jgi:hypothetical protein
LGAVMMGRKFMRGQGQGPPTPFAPNE